MDFRSRCFAVVAVAALAAPVCLADVEATRETFTISGSLGLPGVTMQGFPGAPVSDDNGCYSVVVPHGWSGTISPVREGFLFAPVNKQYASVRKDMENQDYVAARITFTISGQVGLAGVIMRGLPGQPITDARGLYLTQVDYGWTGVVTPEKEGYTFEPPQRMYTRLAADQTNENYSSRQRTLTISDCIIVGDEPLEGVTVTADPGEASVVTDSRGRYSLEVPFGWTGQLTLSKPGFVFTPSSKPYRNLTMDIVDGKARPPAGLTVGRSRATGRFPGQPPLRPSSPPNVLVVPTMQVDPAGFAEMTEDLGVMLHILQEKLSKPQTILGVLDDYGDFFASDSEGARALYIQGHSVLFLMEVNFPLPSAVDAPVRVEREPAGPVDPVWQRAREKLYSPGSTMRRLPAATETISFEQFQEDLLKTLKHAANIRHVDPNEKVILTVLSQSGGALPPGAGGFGGSAFGRSGGGGYAAGGSAGGFSGGSSPFGGGAGGGSFRSESFGYGFGTAGSSLRRGAIPAAAASATTVLTMQARKADIDAFARGELDVEQFREKVKTFAY
ncbi:MAG: hypothetical protein JW741_21430 [Sedimentisphaerales bacterium]|nr:hypothetical protein [Sedimentisphaerales bacterium]